MISIRFVQEGGELKAYVTWWEEGEEIRRTYPLETTQATGDFNHSMGFIFNRGFTPRVSGEAVEETHWEMAGSATHEQWLKFDRDERRAFVGFLAGVFIAGVNAATKKP